MSGTTTSSRRTQVQSSDVNDMLIQFNKLVDDIETLRLAHASQIFSTPGLVIKAGGNVLAKAGTAFRYIVPGIAGAIGTYGLVAANTDMASLVGISVTNAKFNIIVFTVADLAGVQTFAARAGTEGATRKDVIPPSIAETEAIIGFVEINPTGTGNFVGGTTALDDGTVVPNAVYVNGSLGNGVFRAVQKSANLLGAKIGNSSGTAITS